MKIESINNMSFGARIKLAKANTAKLVQGATTAALGTASLVTGLDSFKLGVDSNIAENIYESILNERIEETPDGINVEHNLQLANTASWLMSISLPLGSLVMSDGVEKIIDSYKNKEKNIPD